MDQIPEYNTDTRVIQYPHHLVSYIDISPYINLNILNLSYNIITNINVNLHRIKVVNLEHNRLTNFKVWTPSLKMLNISHNFIRNLVIKSPHVTDVNAGYNPIRRFYSWPKNYVLNLERCHLKKWTLNFGNVNLNHSKVRVINAHIHTLHISGCSLKYIKGTFVLVYGMSLPRRVNKGVKLA